MPAFRLLPELLLEPGLPPRVGVACGRLERLRHLLDHRVGLLGAQFQPAGSGVMPENPIRGCESLEWGIRAGPKGFHPFG